MRSPRSFRPFLCLMAAVGIAFTATSHGQQPAAGPEFFPGQVVVQFRSGVDDFDKVMALGAVNAMARTELTGIEGAEVLATNLPVAQAIANLRALPEVEFAEPNYVLRHAAVSNDPIFTGGTLWGMYGNGSTPANDFGSQAAELWTQGFIGSSNVFVGVIDEGIDFNHPDLAENIWTNPFDGVDGIDNDSNGRIDDIHGWDFFQDNNTVYDGAPGDNDTDAHGTHVAGTIGGKGGNGQGVAGVNWNVTMISGKFLGPNGGSTAAAAQAVDYFTDLKTRHNMNIVATSNSWGGGGDSLVLRQAINRAAKQNILFIAAAGNSATNNDSSPHFPSNYSSLIDAGSETAASYEAVISVASIALDGSLSSFSNFGATSVDIGAPGSAIPSTTPNNTYSTFNGTSMATPHVTGAAAMFKAMNPNATALEIRNAILTQGIPTSSLAGKTSTGNRLNIGGFQQVTAGSLTINNVLVSEGNSGTKNASFTVTLSEVNAANVSVNFTTADGTAIGGVTANSSSISIPNAGSATPYPSSITVPSGIGNLTKVTATLTGFSHTFPDDVDVLLVGPGGQSVVLMSDVGSGTDVTNLNLVFDDSGAALSTATITSGTFKPTNLGTSDVFFNPAPAGPYGTTMSVFNTLDPAGEWKLFVMDDFGGDTGSISGGWSLTLTPAPTSDYTPTSGTLNINAGQLSGILNVVVKGDTLAEASETFTVNLSGGNLTIADNQGIATILSDDFTDPSLAVGSIVRAAHITELRTVVNAARSAVGLGAFTFTESDLAVGFVIKAVHVTELRTALAEAYSHVGREPPTYTGAAPGIGVPVLLSHITELRAAVLALGS
jgi:subtilisin-like proprotein convertase family protein